MSFAAYPKIYQNQEPAMSKPRRFRFILILMILFLILGCNMPFGRISGNSSPENTQPVQADTQVPVNSTPTQMDVAVESDISIDYLYTDGLVTSLYHLYGTVLDNFVDVVLSNEGSQEASLVVETYIEGYTTTSSDTVRLEPGESIEVNQNPLLKTDAVDQLNSEKPATFHIRVTQIAPGDAVVLLDDSQQILMYSRRDFVWIDGFETNEEYELWAAWVTPTDPAVEELLRAAADYTSSGMMWSGYGGEEDDESGAVWERLEAIWEAEDNHYDLTYISTMVAFGPNTVQRMRLPAEVLEQASGNCVELTTLYASAAEAIGLESAIVRIPGHAFVAIRTDQNNANYYFIETTLIGRTNFSDAVDAGLDAWNDASPNLDAGEEGYVWVTIQTAREKGILPIPWN